MENLDVQNSNRTRLVYFAHFIQAFSKWKQGRDVSLTKILRESLQKVGVWDDKYDIRELLRAIVYEMNVMMIVQEFTLSYEFFKGKTLNSAIPINNKKYKNIKIKIDIDGKEKTTNAQQLFDIIRQAFAHNDDSLENPNWFLDLKNNIHIKSKIKNTENRHNIIISAEDLLELSLIFRENINEIRWFNFDVKTKQLENAVKTKTLNLKNINQYFILHDPITKQKINLNEFERQTLFNMLTKLTIFNQEKADLFNPFNEAFLFRIYPNIKYNFSELLGLSDVRDFLRGIPSSYTSYNKFKDLQFKQRMNNVKDLNREDLSEKEVMEYEVTNFNFLINEIDNFKLIMMSNLLFSTISTVSIDKLKEFCDARNIDARKLRNSVIHGRYFYDYDNEFLFFDGINEFSLVAKLNVNDIFKLANDVVKNYMQEKSV